MFYFLDNSLVFMLFFMFLYCIPIMVIVFQVKSLMDTRLLILWSTHFSLQTTHFITVIISKYLSRSNRI